MITVIVSVCQEMHLIKLEPAFYLRTDRAIVVDHKARRKKPDIVDQSLKSAVGDKKVLLVTKKCCW